MIYDGSIVIEDAKHDRANFKVHFDPVDVNSDPVTAESCLAVLESIASQMVNQPLILGRVVEIYIKIYADINTLAGNPIAPEGNADIQERVKLTGTTEGGHSKRWTIPTVDETSLTPSGDVVYDAWENVLHILDNNGLSIAGDPYVSDRRGDHIRIGSIVGVEYFKK